MSDELRRKKKTARKNKSQPNASALVPSIVGAVIVVGIVIGLAVMSMRRSGQNGVATAPPIPTSPSSIAEPASSPVTNPTGSSVPATIYSPVITAEAEPLQDSPVAEVEGRFDVRLPVGWKHSHSPRFGAEFDAEKISGPADLHRRPILSFIPSPQPATNTLKMVADGMVETNRKAGRPILDDRPTRISGYDARRLIYESDLPADLLQAWSLPAGEKSRTLVYLIGPIDSMIFIVLIEAHNDNNRFDKLLPTFEAMMSTFRIPAGAAAR